MAKIRIYELARDFNMTNKALLEKIRDLDLPVKSHMSSLDEDAVAKIKAHIFGAKGEQIEETRVKPTVIRRRRRVVSKEPEASPADEAPAEEAAAEAPAEEAAVETPPPAAETAEAEAAAPEESPATEEAAAEPPAKVVRKRKEAARIIRKPEAPKAPEPEAPPAPETPADEAPAEEAAAEAPAEKTPEAPQAEAAPAEEKPAEEKAAEKPAGEAPKAEKAPEAEKPAEPVVKPMARIKKRLAKKETPAKIIKLGPPPELRRERPAATGVQGPPAGTGDRDAGKKGRKKDKDRKFFKKKISFRRKAVVEGADLYSGGGRGRRGRKGAKSKAASATAQKTQITTAKAIKRRIKIDETIVLSDLAKRMGIKSNELIMKLMGMGVMATVNQTIDFDTAALVAAEFNYELEKAVFEEEAVLKVQEDEPGKLVARPPVVTVMGHVDHGKTSLLDVIRKTRVTQSEAGGITQHIGAYKVETDKGQIVFLDTPGHEAFTSMRSRGASVTDIVVLVVAADDGVMPQTVEAINHARAAEVPIIVAINKIDKANADPDRVQRELAENGLTPEDWGGDTIFVKVSAKQNQGIDELLEMIMLQAEILELKANPDKLAFGHVVEAKLDSGRGPVATVLIQEGTLHTGEPVVCGVHYGKVRSLINDRGERIESAGPATPVEILGLSGVPQAGDELIALKDEKDAKQVSEHRLQKQRAKELAKTSRMSLDKLFEKMREGDVKDLNIILKADVHGSIEALRDSLTKLSNEEVRINIVHAATGTITESDVSLAAVSDAIIIGFNVRPSPKVQALANDEQIDMRYYNVIYNVIKDVKDAIVGMMSSTFEEQVLGQAEVREVFHVPKVGAIAGCYVTDGKIERGRQVRLLRDGVVSYEGRIASLRRFKDDVKEVQSGYECGIGIENYNDIKVGDIIECFYLEEIKPELKE